MAWLTLSSFSEFFLKLHIIIKICIKIGRLSFFKPWRKLLFFCVSDIGFIYFTNQGYCFIHYSIFNLTTAEYNSVTHLLLRGYSNLHNLLRRTGRNTAVIELFPLVPLFWEKLETSTYMQWCTNTSIYYTIF